ncbi:MAG: hypothetical protein AAB681_02370 [Patescibacteria group bacterium]
MSLRSILGAVSPNARSLAHEKVEEIARKNFLGTNDCYSFKQGVREVAESFNREKKPFGHYMVKGENVFYINEPLLSKKELGIVKNARTEKTGFPGVLYLKQGATTTLRKEPAEIFLPAGYEGI